MFVVDEDVIYVLFDMNSSKGFDVFVAGVIEGIFGKLRSLPEEK